jgi:hypothetical protein
MLTLRTIDLDGTFDVNTAPQQAGLPVDLVTGERAIAATDTQIHVHHQQITAIDNSGCDFLLGRGQQTLINALAHAQLVSGI